MKISLNLPDEMVRDLDDLAAADPEDNRSAVARRALREGIEILKARQPRTNR